MSQDPLEKIRADFSRLKKSCESIRLVSEYGDKESAILLGYRTTTLLRKFLEDLKSQNDYNRSFLSMVMNNKMPHLEEDARYFELWKDSEALADEQELHIVNFRLEKNIQTLERELKSMYPMDFSIKKWKTKVGRPVGFFAIIIVVVLIIAEVLNYARGWHHGLVGEYYKDKDFVKFAQQRIDRTIDFDWGMDAPLRHFKPDNFSIRWTGFLKTPKESTYEFTTHSDDGVRLYIDDQLIIHNWNAHDRTINRGRIILSKGVHRIKLEYYDLKYNAVIKLFWKYGSKTEAEIIRTKYFYPNESYANE